jgi:putative serine protease PepD
MYEPDEHHASVKTQPLPPRFEGPPPPAAQPPKPRGGWRPIAAAALVAAVVSAGITVPLTQALTPNEPSAFTPSSPSQPDTGAPARAAANGALSVEEIASRIVPAVGRVDVVSRIGQNAGSAVVFRRDGYLLTNNHVVAGARQVEVQMPDGQTYDAQVVGADPTIDLAVLKIDVGNLPVPEFATQPPRIGATVVAVGSPFGLDGTVTAGVVSQLGRQIDAPDGEVLLDTIQTDAAINFGNSGGPLVDDHARVIGLNTAIVSPSGANDGIGFAIPITTAVPVAQQLIEQGFVERAQLGVSIQPVPPVVSEQFGLPESGALVSDVTPGSAADRAGLQRGDVITEVNGEPLETSIDLTAQIRALKPGDEVRLTIMRDGREREVTATLGTAPRASQ